MLVIAAVAPHGGIAVAEATKPETRHLAAKTRSGMGELGRRFAQARPETVVVISPHNVHVEGALAVVTSGWIAGDLRDTPEPVALRCQVDRPLARAIRDSIRRARVPVAGVSYGGNDPEDAAKAANTMPMDWGVLIPLWFCGGRFEPPVEVVAVSPARDLDPEQHLKAGRALAAAVGRSGRRVGLIASADHGHAHAEDGPYGYHPAAAAYDEQIVQLIRSGRLAGLEKIDPQLVADAKADSWWQLLVLQGALGTTWRGELISYEAPTYFGMLCAAYAGRAMMD